MNSKKDDFLNQIIDSLSIEEKAGQLLQIAPFFFLNDVKVEIFGALEDLNLNEVQIFNAGSVLGIGSAKDMIAVQKKYLEKSRHKIPLLFMADIVHGYKTIFPVPIALASSFNPSLAEKTARVSAKEATTAGIHVTFSPVADITKDPRWGRVVETFGEDYYLASKMSVAMIEGYQNTDISKKDSLAACVKHFAAYGACQAGRDYFTVNISRHDLYSEYLKPYKASLDAGARLIMTAFNTFEGIPCTVNKFLLKDILRDSWKQDCVTISDYDSLKQIISHGVAKDMEEVALKGMKAGLDIEMQSTAYVNNLKKLIDSGKIQESILDEAVYRVLKLKKDIGLFDNPYKGAILDDSLLVLTNENLQIAKEVAHESIVLLENDGILPIKEKTKVSLIGPYANNKSIIGPWSWHGKRDLHPSLNDVLNKNVVYMNPSSNIEAYKEEDILKIKESELIIFALGEPDWLSGEAHSRTDITLPDNQEKLIKLAKKANLPYIVLLFNGRPLVLNDLVKANAVLECWFLGSESSNAIKDILYGKINPSGKLPISFPRNIGQIPIFYNHLNTGRPYIANENNEYVSKYMDSPNTPLYCFGYGLSYSKFEYSNIKVSNKKMSKEDSLLVSVEIYNNSDYFGKEVVQLYIKDLVAEVSRPVKELKKFKKIDLNPYEKKTIDFTLTISDLTYQDIEGKEVFDYGEFTISIGSSSDNTLDENIELIEG